ALQMRQRHVLVYFAATDERLRSIGRYEHQPLLHRTMNVARGKRLAIEHDSPGLRNECTGYRVGQFLVPRSDKAIQPEAFSRRDRQVDLMKRPGRSEERRVG